MRDTESKALKANIISQMKTFDSSRRVLCYCKDKVAPSSSKSVVELSSCGQHVIWQLERVLFQNNMLPEDQKYFRKVIQNISRTGREESRSF